MKIRLVWTGIVVLFIAVMFTTSSSAVLDPDTIVGMWKFDEGKGNTAKDSSENGNDGTLMSNPKWVDGKFGKALEFDGTNFVDMGNDESLQFDGDVTIVCWVRPESVAGGRQNIVCKSYGGEGCLTQETDGRLSFYWGDCGGNCQPYVEVARPAPGTFVDDEWIHVAEVRDVSKREYRMYKDGEVTGQDKWHLLSQVYISGRNVVRIRVETPAPVISICLSAPVMLVNTEASLMMSPFLMWC